MATLQLEIEKKLEIILNKIFLVFNFQIGITLQIKFARNSSLHLHFNKIRQFTQNLNVTRKFQFFIQNVLFK